MALKTITTILVLSNFLLAGIISNFKPLLSREKEPVPEKEISPSLRPQKLPIENYMDTFLLKAEANPDFWPIRNWNINDLEIEANSAVLFEPEKGKFIFGKNSREKLAIASLTKLINALVVIENENLTEIVKIGEKAIKAEGETGGLILGEEISIENLLKIMLITSSNDAAVGLAEYIGDKVDGGGEKTFVGLMNKKAESLGLSETHFANPNGLDAPENYSTAMDLAKLAAYLFRYPLVWEFSIIKEINVTSADGKISHPLSNRNELLGEIPFIIGGKTGYTSRAGECMLLIIQIPETRHKLISVVLGAKDRFKTTQDLINWAREAFLWQY